MKKVAVLFLSWAALSCAQERKADKPAEKVAGEKRRLESVTWDLDSHKLIWVVQKGVEENGAFKPKMTQKYEITPDEAMMAFANEKREFTAEEAINLRGLLDTLSLYCAESVIWWEQGQGEKVPSGGKSERVNQPKPRKEPPVKPAMIADSQSRDRSSSEPRP